MATARMRIAFRAAPLVLLFVGGLGIAHAGQYPEAVLAPHGNELLRQSFGPTEIDFSGIMVALDEGADPNLAIDGVPVTYLAAQRRRLDIAETLLLDGGAAPPPCTSAMGACPVTAIVDHVRKLGGFTNHVTGPYTRGEGYTWLVQHGVDVDSVDASGNTALMLAASRGKLDITLALLKAGADPLRHNNWGYTAKAGAIGNSHPLVALLIAYYGGSDYLGTRLPDSPATRAVQAQDQLDMTGAAYREMPWLPSGIRFFLTCDHRPPRPDPPPVPYGPAPLNHVVNFAVLPGSNAVVKLTGNSGALAALGARIDTVKQAQTALAELSDAYGIAYEGRSLTTLPRADLETSHYLRVTGSAAIQLIKSLGPDTIQPIREHGVKAWIYTRTMVPPDLIPGGYGSETEIHVVYRVRERIDALGNYRLLDLKETDTPPLKLYRTCCALL